MSELHRPSERIELEGTNGIAVRQLVLADAQAYFDLIDFDRKHLSQVHSGILDRTAIKYPTVEAVQRSIEFPEDPTKLRFGIWIGDVMVGSNNLKPIGYGRVESGSFVGKKYIGHGYAAAGRELLVQIAWQLGYDKVLSRILVGNEASRKSVERSGFTYLGIDEDHWVYLLEKSDYLARLEQ